jgi:hypothetical protein
MKLSERTLSVLKNFAQINSGIVLRKGKTLRTVSLENTILAEANVDEDFTETFGIYELNDFLGNVTTLTNPELTFTHENVLMKDGDIEFNYMASSLNLIVSPPEDKSIAMKDPDVSFDISQSNLQKLLRLAAMNDLTHISISNKNGGIYLQTLAVKNDTSNSVSLRVADYDGVDFKSLIKVENLKMISDDYNVVLKIGGFTSWTNKSGTLKYFIALEKK